LKPQPTFHLNGNVPPEHRLEPVNLRLVLPEHCILWIFIDLWLVLDVLRAVRVSQRAQRLVVIVVRRRQTGHHQRLRVSAKGVLEKSRQLGVAVRNVRRLAVDERGYDIAEGGQREVDFCGFL